MATIAGVLFEEDYIVNARGMRLFTCRWLPGKKEVRALIFLCHGYGMESSVYSRETGLRLARAGYGVFGIDYEGHGKSEGLQGYVPNFDDLLTDCETYFNNVMDSREYAGKSCFLYGESMGGAVSILIGRRNPARWNGMVLVAPMCKLSEKMKPPQIVTAILCRLADLVPTWQIVPTTDIIDTAFKDPIKRHEIRSNPYTFQGNPRLKTAAEVLRIAINVERHLDDVTLPFLCLHGEADVVTDPGASAALYKYAGSHDKTLKLYPGMWHGLTAGEPDDNVDKVFEDIISWLNERVNYGASSPHLSSASIANLDCKIDAYKNVF